jgi:hypothetical protein
MQTVWNGDSLILEFATRNIDLSLSECEEFDKWVCARIENALGME